MPDHFLSDLPEQLEERGYAGGAHVWDWDRMKEKKEQPLCHKHLSLAPFRDFPTTSIPRGPPLNKDQPRSQCGKKRSWNACDEKEFPALQ